MASSHDIDHSRIAVLISFSGEGGVERMVCNLIGEFTRRGHGVDLLLIKADSPHVNQLPAAVNVVRLGTTHTMLSLWPLVRYLRRSRPQRLLVAKHRAIVIAVLARTLSGVAVRIVGRLGTNLSAALKGKSSFRRWFWRKQMRWVYPRVDRIVAVSDGVAADIRQLTGLGADKISVIRNPVITAQMLAMAGEAAPHPWLAPGQAPVLLGAGRFTPQKDFFTLIRAFALLRKTRNCRLILLGNGALQPDYERLAGKLGVVVDIAFPGFSANPYAYMGRAAVFVLSSAWEGSPNVLTEAMALGTPVVATDCHSGPREILQDGRYGPLVRVGDGDALAVAIAAALDHPPAAAQLKQAVGEYTVENSARHYLEALGFDSV